MSATGTNGPRPFDAGALDAVNRFAVRTPWLHGITAAYAGYGVVLLAGLLLGGWWLARTGPAEQMAAALWAGAAGLVGLAVNLPVVAFFAEARPYALDPSLLVLAHRTTDPAFPSDHAVLAGAVVAALWFVDRRLAIAATGSAILLTTARVYTAAHYPHDVIVGLLLGAVVGATGHQLTRRLLTALVVRFRGTSLRLVLGAPEPQLAAGAERTRRDGGRMDGGRRGDL